jgi:succinate dehydrogenase/fumarate reductase flavoprotein subunit
MKMEKELIEWPYPIDYNKVNIVDTDVLVLGGGIAGSWAALAAIKRGVKVTIVEEMDIFSAGPAGVDHIVYALDNPCCTISPEEFIEGVGPWQYWDYINGISHYIMYREGYDMLCELEKMGAKIRDTEDEFKGAEFRDDETKLMFAYDYDTKHTLRVWGATFRPALTAELKRQRVSIHNRVKVTSFLTEGGEEGSRILGATGINVRTGEFYVFKAKATVLTTGRGGNRVWDYRGGSVATLPRSSGGGLVMAWNAGAELANMEGRAAGGGDSYPRYGTGNPLNTWYPCTMIDAKGKEIPYVDGKGNILTSFEQRVHPSLLGQRFFLERSYRNGNSPVKRPVSLCHTPKFAEAVRKGEYTLPIYADLPGMPEDERRAIFGLMIANEGMTWILYKNYAEAGFDPDKDLLQAYSGGTSSRYDGSPLVGTKKSGYRSYLGGLVHDWDFKTSLEGLYAAGESLFSVHYHGLAAISGRWAGAKAADYAKDTTEPEIFDEQVEKERERVYAPINRTEGIDWKELNAGVSGAMRTYGGDTLTDEMLNLALVWLKELEEKEAQELIAGSPRELARCLQSMEVLKLAEMWTHAALTRKASCRFLTISKLEYPDNDPPEWHKFITIKKGQDTVEVGDRPLYYWNKQPYALTYKENYERHKPWGKK